MNAEQGAREKRMRKRERDGGGQGGMREGCGREELTGVTIATLSL